MNISSRAHLRNRNTNNHAMLKGENLSRTTQFSAFLSAFSFEYEDSGDRKRVYNL